jgi:hypothetical protein
MGKALFGVYLSALPVSLRLKVQLTVVVLLPSKLISACYPKRTGERFCVFFGVGCTTGKD